MIRLLIIFIFIFFYNTSVFADANTDQWKDSNLTYKDLIDLGFKVKAYDTTTITAGEGLIILFFVFSISFFTDLY